LVPYTFIAKFSIESFDFSGILYTFTNAIFDSDNGHVTKNQNYVNARRKMDGRRLPQRHILPLTQNFEG